VARRFLSGLDRRERFCCGRRFEAVLCPRLPNMNAYAERFVQTVKLECLDHFVCFGVEHLRYIVSEFLTHYNQHRPHQSLNNRPIPEAEVDADSPSVLRLPSGEVACEERLGGLLKHYYRKAA
jgi:putative transposase